MRPSHSRAQEATLKRSSSTTLSWVGIFTLVLGAIAAAQAVPRANDQDFVSRLAMSNMAAIQLAHLATKKAQDADVQKFATATIESRLKAQKQLADAASGAGIRWPTKLDEKYGQVQGRLSKLSNDKFDREYMKATIEQDREFERMLASHANEGSEGPPLAANVNQWAAMTLPEIRARIKEAEEVSGRLGKAE